MSANEHTDLHSGVAKLELMVGPQWNIYHDPSMDEANLSLLPSHLIIVIIHIYSFNSE